MKEITDAFGYWFSGFTDGEACFSIHKRRDKSPCASYRCRFEIGLRDDDRAILEKIRDTLGMGYIFDRPVSSNSTPNAHSSSMFEVSIIKDCVVLVRLFDKYPLQSKKQNDFAIWKEAVKELQKPCDCRNADLLEYYFCKIKEVRQYEKQAELIKPKRIELQLTIEF